MDFGDVIKSFRKDERKRFTRKGWNGANAYIYLSKRRVIESYKWTAPSEAHRMTATEQERQEVVLLPHIDMVTSQGERVIGWLASQTDMLSDDWMVVE